PENVPGTLLLPGTTSVVPPSTGTRFTWPETKSAKYTSLPSGEQAGKASKFPEERCTGFEPAAPIRHTVTAFVLPCRANRLKTKNEDVLVPASVGGSLHAVGQAK